MSATTDGDRAIARRIVAGILVTAVLALGGWMLFGGVSGGDRDASNASGDPAPPVRITPRGSGVSGWTIAPAETVAIDHAELPAPGGMAVLDLVLGEPSANDLPLSGRILSFDTSRPDRVRELSAAVVGAGRESVRIDVPAEFLTVGTYLIEIRTTEKNHFPLRRYRLEVR